MFKGVAVSSQTKQIIEDAIEHGSFSFDVEHRPELTFSCEDFRLHGCSFATFDSIFYLQDEDEITEVCEELFPLDIEAIAYNAKYDIKCLRAAGLIDKYAYPRTLCDPMVAINLLEDNRRPNELGLKRIVQEKFEVTMMEFTEAWKRGGIDFINYAMADAKWELKVWHKVKPKLIDEGLDDLFTKILMPVSKVFADMELEGIGWDLHGARDLLRGFQKLRDSTEKEIYSKIGSLNINSGDQLARRLFDELGYSSVGIEMTKSKKRLSVDAKAMDHLAKRYPIAHKVRLHRTATKMINTYVEPLTRMALDDPEGRVHPTYWLVSTTGRTRCEKPNFQNCFSDDTEVLTEWGWIRFDSLPKDIKVAQYDIGLGRITFEYPTQHIENEYDGYLIHLHTKKGFDLLVTPDHRCLVQNRKSLEWKKYQARAFPEDRKQASAGKYLGGTLQYSEAQIVLICAFQADGHITKQRGIDWGFTKERKFKRLLWALHECDVSYHLINDKRRLRLVVEYEDIPRWLQEKKVFGGWVMNLTYESRKLFCEESYFWDGCWTRKTMYSSNEKSNVDWLQIAHLLTGKRSRLRLYKEKNWQLDVAGRDYCLTTNTKREQVPYSGKVYCVTMPKGTVIVRRNGKACITGNCPAFLAKEFGHLSIRKNVIAASGRKLIVNDFSQIELRMIAHITGDPMFLKAYQDWKCPCGAVGSSDTILHECPDCGVEEDEDGGFWHGLDLHQMTCDNVSVLETRAQGKMANFALAYCATAMKMHYEYPKLGKRKWQEAIDGFMDTYIGVQAWHLRMQRTLYETGICTDIFGRKRRILTRDIKRNPKNALNMIVNFAPQASACALSELCLVKMREKWIDQGLWMTKVFPTNFIHDEIVLEADEDIIPQVVSEMNYIMENTIKLKVPIRAGAGVADNWSSAK